MSELSQPCGGCDHTKGWHRKDGEGPCDSPGCRCEGWWQLDRFERLVMGHPEWAWYWIGLFASGYLHFQLRPLYADRDSLPAAIIFGFPLQLMIGALCYMCGRMAQLNHRMEERHRAEKKAKREADALAAEEAKRKELIHQNQLRQAEKRRVAETPKHTPDQCEGPSNFPGSTGGNDRWSDGCDSVWRWERISSDKGSACQWVQRSR